MTVTSKLGCCNRLTGLGETESRAPSVQVCRASPAPAASRRGAIRLKHRGRGHALWHTGERHRSGNRAPFCTGAHAPRLVCARAGELSLARFLRKRSPRPESDNSATSGRDPRRKEDADGQAAQA